ncbi:MAG: hypothetical protein ACREGH_04450 [Minisyncoccia bacterium]
MLNVFPGLLTYTFFAPTILRLAVAITLFIMAGHTWRHRQHLMHVRLLWLAPEGWMPYVATLGECILGVFFFIGLYTQVAAIVGIVGMVKYAIYRHWWPDMVTEYFPIAPGTAWLIAIICLSLLLTGAGAGAFDIPL